MLRIDDSRLLMDRGDNASSAGGGGSGGSSSGGSRGPSGDGPGRGRSSSAARGAASAAGRRGTHAGAFSGIGESRTPGAASIAGAVTGSSRGLPGFVNSFINQVRRQPQAFTMQSAIKIGAMLAGVNPAFGIGMALAGLASGLPTGQAGLGQTGPAPGIGAGPDPNRPGTPGSNKVAAILGGLPGLPTAPIGRAPVASKSPAFRVLGLPGLSGIAPPPAARRVGSPGDTSRGRFPADILFNRRLDRGKQ